MDIKAKPGKE